MVSFTGINFHLSSYSFNMNCELFRNFKVQPCWLQHKLILHQISRSSIQWELADNWKFASCSPLFPWKQPSSTVSCSDFYPSSQLRICSSILESFLSLWWEERIQILKCWSFLPLLPYNLFLSSVWNINSALCRSVNSYFTVTIQQKVCLCKIS